MKINVTVTENDYLKFNEFYLKNSSQGKKTALLLRAALPLIFLIILFLCLIARADIVLIIIEAITFLIASLIWIIRVPAVMKNNIKRDISAIKKDGKLPYHDTTEIEFTDSSIVETTNNSTLSVNYSDIISVNKTEEHIFIFFGAAQAFIIPRRCVNNENYFERILREHIH